MRKPFAFLFLCSLVLCSCGKPEPVYLGFVFSDVPEHSPGVSGAGFGAANLQAAGAFLEALLAEGDLPLGLRLVPDMPGMDAQRTEPDLVIELFSHWGFEPPVDVVIPDALVPVILTPVFGEPFLLSRTYLVPRTTLPEGRRDVSLAACLAGEETLTVLGELSPPELALPVEGLTAEDEGYPLVWETWTRLRRGLKNGPGPDNAKRESGISALGEQMAGLLQERLEAAPNPLVEPKPDLLWLAVAGDLMLGRGAGDILLREGPQGIFGKTADFFAQADLALLNLEGAVSSRGGRIEKTYNFRFPPAMAGALRDAGIDAVLLANNHVYDFGPEAFLDTLDHLTNARVGIFGAGRDSAAAAAPFVFDRGGGKAAVHVFGIASFPSETGWSALSIAAGENQPGILHAGRGGAEKLKEGFTGEALDLVFFHGGNEWTTAPDARTRAIYTDLIRSGADIIIGSHPHIVQGFEWIQGKPVFWSLGNFVFAGMDNTGGGDHGLFLRLGFLGMNPVYIEPYPVTLSGPRTEIAPLENLKGFYALSK